MKHFLLWLCIALLTSCASNKIRSVQKISITTDEKVKLIFVDTSLTQMNKKAMYKVGGWNDTILIKLQLETFIHEYTLKPKRFFGPVYVASGDKNNPYRYIYPEKIHFREKDGELVRQREKPIPKGSLNFNAALPWVNFFNVNIESGKKKSGGFLGIEAGLDYHYSNRNYFSSHIGMAMDFPLPFPAPYDRFNEYETISNWYLNARNNHVLNRFTVGYGISHSEVTWKLHNSVDSSHYNDVDTSYIIYNDKSEKISTTGLSISTTFRCFNSFQIGLLYQPYFIDIKKFSMTDYQHFISIELIWKIRIKTFGKEKNEN